MTPTSNNSKRNLILILGIVFAFLLLLVVRLGWIQIVKGSTYSEKAVEQQTRDTPIEAERGTIYDRNGNELAVSVTCYTIWVRPADVKKTEEKDAAKQKAEIEKKTKEKILHGTFCWNETPRLCRTKNHPSAGYRSHGLRNDP